MKPAPIPPYFTIASGTYGDFLDTLDAWRQEQEKTRFACFCDANGLAFTTRDPELLAAYQAADAVLADGTVTKALAWIHGHQLPERIIGPYLFPKAMAYGVEKGWRHFFYGAGPGTAELLAEKMREAYPGVNIVGTLTPPFGALTEEEDAAHMRQIEAARPDILWVALGCPKQEKWAHNHVGKVKVPIILPVGAVFDFYSGRIPHAPDWVHALHMRWLWRLLTGGKRTFKRNAWCVPRAAWFLITEFWRLRLRRGDCR
ncbi:MAG: WecB/TagA/CpsF family glycosyltransferase [Verrucomicrobia bacterium]|nr:WecB/TagA/CpsF family glycosyltransferase [Verrucomicrobiota bacterium]